MINLTDVIGIASVCTAAVAVIGVHSRQHRYAGKHVLRAAPPELADPQDVTDPDGARFVAQITGRREPKAAVRVHTPPAAATLARVRVKLMHLPVALPAPGPAVTAPIPHAVGTWGKTPAQLADELAAEHLAVTR